MRVLIISTLFRGGGAERSARELLEVLPQTGVSASMLVAIRKTGDPESVSQARLSGERYLQAVRKIFGPVDWIHIGSKLALNRINRENCDLVHLHNVHGSWMSLKALQGLCRRMPTVWTLHDEWATSGGLPYDLLDVKGKIGDEIRNRPGTELLFSDTKPAIRLRRYLDHWRPQPGLLICPSLYLQELVQKSRKFIGVECARVPYGLRFKELPDTARPRQESRREMGLEADDRVILLAAAQLNSHYKGISLAIEALKLLPARGFKVLIIGRGAGDIAQQIPQQVVAPGFLTDDKKIAAAYRAANVTLVPSLADNFPYVALESMACATPLATFRVGGLTEMVGDNQRGLLASPFDVAEFARNIHTILDSAELGERLGHAGRNWVDENCDMSKWAQTHFDLYQQTCDRFSARGIEMSRRSQTAIEMQ